MRARWLGHGWNLNCINGLSWPDPPVPTTTRGSERMADVFVSYARTDKAQVAPLAGLPE